MPCSLSVASLAENPRAFIALESFCAKPASESMRRILLDTRDPETSARQKKSTGRPGGVSTKRTGVPTGWEEVWSSAHVGGLHEREHVRLVEIGDERIDDLVVAPGSDVEAPGAREPDLAVRDAPRRAGKVRLRVVHDQERDAAAVGLRKVVGDHRGLALVHAGEPHALQLRALREAGQMDAEVYLALQPLLRGTRVAGGEVEWKRARMQRDAVLDERMGREERMGEPAREEPGRRAHAGRRHRDGARLLEGAGPAAVRSLRRELFAHALVEEVGSGSVGAQHRGLVALVQADGVGAGGAFVEVQLHLGALLGRELPVHVGVEEGLLELAALLPHARLLNSRTSASSSTSTCTLSSIACLPWTTPDSTA